MASRAGHLVQPVLSALSTRRGPFHLFTSSASAGHDHDAVGCREDEKSTGTGIAAAYEADLGLGCDCGVLFAARCVWRGEQLAAGGLVEFGVINRSKLLQLWRVARRLNTPTAIVCRYPDTLGIGANLHKQLR